MICCSATSIADNSPVVSATAAAPAFARGQPQLPNDDGRRVNVLRELNPTRVTDDARPHPAGVVSSQGGEIDRTAAPCRS